MKNGSLIEVKPRWFDRFYLVSNFQYNYDSYYHKRTVNDAKIYFEEAAKEIRKHWKKTKFIILDYPTNEYSNGLNINIPDYKIIHIKDIVEEDLLDPKYKVDTVHPKASTWEFIIPKIMKNIGIKIEK